MTQTGSMLIPFVQLCVAVILGMVLGIERVLAGRTAGPRTYGLVSMGSCLITILSLHALELYPGVQDLNPLVLVSTIVSGVGFIGAGLIVFHQSHLSGLTTAAGIWVSAAIGITVGYGFYLLAIFATFLTLFVFTVMWNVENLIKKKFTIMPDEDRDKYE
jgi:putative Mg2+ transporter-C (MgtC) family protein